MKTLVFMSVLLLNTTAALAAAAETITVQPFKVSVPSEKIEVTRFVLAIECGEGLEKTHFFELKVNNSGPGLYTAELPSANSFEVDTKDLCSVEFRAFSYIEKPQPFAADASSAIYGPTLTSAELKSKNIAADVVKRLSIAKIDGDRIAKYPYFEGFEFSYQPDSSLDFCLQLIGKEFQSPLPASAGSVLRFEEMRTVQGNLTAKFFGPASRQGYAAVYYSCNNTKRTVSLSMRDPAKNDPYGNAVQLNASFNQDLSAMNLRSAVWKSVK